MQTEDARYPAVRPILPAADSIGKFLEDAYRLRFFSNFGPASIAFERACESLWLNDDRGSVLCANATAGLTAALCALRVEGAVAIPAYTFAATESAVRGAGLTPVVVDVDADGAVISSAAIRAAAAQHQIGAVIAVRPHGVWQDLSDVAAACRKIGAALVIDNAAGLGVERPVVEALSVADAIEVFSLHATKAFAVGEGGLIVAPVALQDDLRSALNFGLWSAGRLSPGVGLNGKASEFTAAMALTALEIQPGQRAVRLAAARWYREKLAQLPGWRDLGPADAAHSTWSNFPVLAPPNLQLAPVVERARRSGLVLRRYYHPALSSDAPVATGIAERSLSLPVYGDITTAELNEIWSIFKSAAL